MRGGYKGFWVRCSPIPAVGEATNAIPRPDAQGVVPKLLYKLYMVVEADAGEISPADNETPLITIDMARDSLFFLLIEIIPQKNVDGW